ncbi:Protein translocase subunit secA (chloroplast) [Fragilaria crotonensis]|nr:Protein translocase subunit secA [Fragilaria crotonensis]
MTGQPLLIGTTTVEKSDMLAQLLNEYELSYQILNAKPENVRRESEIVAQAGKKSSITIATNMAGRGTDIILGGNINFQIQKELYDILILAKTELKKLSKFNTFEKYQTRFARHDIIQTIKRLKIITKSCSQKFFSVLVTLITDINFIKLSDIDVLRILQENDRVAIPTISYQCAIRFLLNELTFSTQKHHKQENKIVKNLGGLCVVGTERNDSRRVDDQLRGRCGRQGDPGTSRFFVSLDDNLLRLFGGQKVQQFLRNQIPDDSPIESSLMTESLNNAQKQVEERAYEQRKNLFEYDEILDQQRSIIYFERRLVLESPSVRNNTLAYGEQIVCEFLNQIKKKEIDLNQTVKLFENLFGRSLDIKLLNKNQSNATEFDSFELQTYFFQEFWLTYQAKINQFSVYGNGNKIFRNFERQVTLLNINTVWQEHLEKIGLLREAVGWRGYGQKNPLTEYKEKLIYYLLNVKKL